MTYRFTSLVFVLGSLVGAQGQTCNSICENFCGSPADLGKTQYQNCVGACVGRCSKCEGVTGTLFPKFYVLGLVYAPPGCTSTSTAKCGSQSSVDYQSASSMGTKVSTESSFSSSVDLSVDVGFGDKDATQLSGSASTGYSTTSTDDSSQTITKGQTQDVKVNGNGDGIDHNQDTFILLLNPAIAVKQNSRFSGAVCSATNNVSWHFGLNSTSGTEDLFTLSVAQLKNPASMPQNVAQQLQTLGFTNADFQTILSLDPFANGSTTVDPSRYSPTTVAFPYEPAQQAQDCNGGVCSCLSISAGLKNDFESGQGETTKTQYQVGLKESVSGINLGIFKLGASSSQQFTWTSTSSTSNTQDDSQTANATVTCPSPTYTGPTIMSVFWDNLYGSFLFVPTVLGPNTKILSRGAVVGTSGHPVAHQPVLLSVAGKTYSTYTDSHGRYVFVSHLGAAQTGAAQVSVEGVRQTVTLSPSQEVTIHVQ